MVTDFYQLGEPKNAKKIKNMDHNDNFSQDKSIRQGNYENWLKTGITVRCCQYRKPQI